MSTSQIPGAQIIELSSQDSTGLKKRQNEMLLSALAKSFLAMCTFLTPMRKISGDTKRVTVFSLTHMAIVCFQEAGGRKMASVGQGNTNISPHVTRQHICSITHFYIYRHSIKWTYSKCLVYHLIYISTKKHSCFSVCSNINAGVSNLGSVDVSKVCLH